MGEGEDGGKTEKLGKPNIFEWVAYSAVSTCFLQKVLCAVDTIRASAGRPSINEEGRLPLVQEHGGRELVWVANRYQPRHILLEATLG